jgi:hypothetical protein
MIHQILPACAQGQARERVRHHQGRTPELGEPIRERARRWLQQQPDLTLAELQEKRLQEAGAAREPARDLGRTAPEDGAAA